MSNKQNEDLMEKSFDAGRADGFKTAFNQISFIMGYLLADKDNFKKIINFIEKDNKI